MPSSDETKPQVTPPDSDPQATLPTPAGALVAQALIVPGYDLQPEIARGGMGIVYRARDLAFDREVAIKVMKPGMSADAFVREARITARLPHPAIPPVYAMGTLPDGRPFLAMKLIQGDTFDKLLDARTDLSADRGRWVAAFEQTCQAVGYAHSRGIVHRDMKPTNVMVGAFGEVQVMDWGLAKEIGSTGVVARAVGPAPAATADSASATVAGQIKGTPAYMAPEQARGEPVDARADVFALGGILAAVLTGKPPFVGTSGLDTIIRAIRADLGDTFERLDASGADAELRTLCKKSLAPNATDRYANATELAHVVAAYRAGVEARLLQAERERAAAEERRKRRVTQRALAASVLLLLLAGGVGAAFASLWRTAETRRDAADSAKLDAEKAKGLAVEQQRIAEQAKAREETARKRLAVFEYGGSMRVAHQEWRDSNLVAMRALLDGSDPELRNWEWRYLNKLCDSSLLTLKGHTGEVRAASFSSDGTRIVTGSLDNTAKVWDAKTGAEVLPLKGHTEVVRAVSFSPDGTRIVTASGSFGKPGEAKVWDAKTGAEELTLKGHTGNVMAAAFSADGTRIVTGSADDTAKVWDAKTGAEVLTLKGHTDIVPAAAFSADGTRIVTGSEDKTSKVWDARPYRDSLTPPPPLSVAPPRAK